MTTLVGTQSNFIDALKDLVELEYDALGAYKLTLEKLSDNTYLSKMREFTKEHESHIANIKKWLATTDADNIPDSGDIVKGMMAKMKVTIGDTVGDDLAILKAMLDNELDTNTAYERMLKYPALKKDIEDILKLAYTDEKKHKAWLMDVTSK